MVMIRCPDCGQHVLDIATACPRCHRVLIQNPLETHNWGALRVCGRCHKHIERDVAVCPFCGYRVRAARLARWTAAGLAVLAILIVASVAAWRSGLVASAGGAVGVAGPTTQPSPPAVEAASESPTPPPAAEVVASPITAAAPADSAPRVRPSPTILPPIAARPPATAPSNALVKRWTGEWANVRAARDVTADVVRVLAPNVAVDVGDIRAGWWALYADGALVGYIANSVLRTEPTEL